MNVLRRVPPSQLLALLLLALLLGSALGWAGRWRGVSGPSPARVPASAALQPTSVAAALGAAREAAAAPLASARYKLMGLLDGPALRGVALIAIDGKPARSYRVGERVADNLVLHSLAARRALLAPSAGADAQPVVTLELVRAAPRALAVAGAAPRADARDYPSEPTDMPERERPMGLPSVDSPAAKGRSSTQDRAAQP